MSAVVLALVLAGCGGPASTCGPDTGVVARVIDGDTVVLATGVAIRYLLIDAPETTNGHHDCYGENATRFNSDRVLGRTVELAYDVQCTDRYGRTLAYVSVDDQDMSAAMIQRGYACFLHIAPDGDARAVELEMDEAEARAAKRGLWGACAAIPCQ